MNYALIREMDISNGLGIGVSLFVQGCHFHCKGCFNPETWDFNGGKPWTEETEEKFIELAKRSYVKRISILGGEPLADQNVQDVCKLIQRIKAEVPDKAIWLYTGYQFENIYESVVANGSRHDLQRWIAVVFSDILVDGQFQIDKQDAFHKDVVFAGSTNQRVIDVRRTIENGINHTVIQLRQ